MAVAAGTQTRMINAAIIRIPADFTMVLFDLIDAVTCRGYFDS